MSDENPWAPRYISAASGILDYANTATPDGGATNVGATDPEARTILASSHLTKGRLSLQRDDMARQAAATGAVPAP